MIGINRYYTGVETNPLDDVTWEKRDAAITDVSGNTFFEQKEVEVPANWSDNAMNIVASKYFFGSKGDPNRESSVRQVVERVAKTITDWGYVDGYYDSAEAEVFLNELRYILVNQIAAFNSPVWFNVGALENPQSSACFINSVEDTMESIMDLATRESMLFKWGSGTGTNLSTLRSKHELVKGGGEASGPVSFMKGYDAFANVIKSGGRCLPGYQRVYTPDRGPVPVSELTDTLFFVLSYDPPAGRFKVKTAEAWKSGYKNVLRITTDKGSFDLSYDHPVRLSTGEYRRAVDLQVDNLLHQCAIDVSDENDLILHLQNGTMATLEHMIVQHVMENDLDQVKRDNTPESNQRVESVEMIGTMDVYSVEVQCPTEDDKSPESGHNFVIWDGEDRTGQGIVVSNTRRSAKMQILNADHPDIMEFIWCKANEEGKAKALIEAGYDASLNGDAYSSVFFQNSNLSVRVSDDFMERAIAGEEYTTHLVTTKEVHESLDAYGVLLAMAEATWQCGDPGIQYDSTINEWHTCSNTDRIYASNPCVTGDTLIATENGLRRIDELVGQHPRILGLDRELHHATRVIKTGHKPVYQLRTAAGFELKLTADHKVWTLENGDVPASALEIGDHIELMGSPLGTKSITNALAEYIGLMLGDGCIANDDSAILTMGHHESAIMEKALAVVNGYPDAIHGPHQSSVRTLPTVLKISSSRKPVVADLSTYAVLNELSDGKRLTRAALELDKPSLAGIIRGLFTAAGTVANYTDSSQYVALDSTSLEMLQQVQQLLLSFGIKAKLYSNRKHQTTAMLPDANRNPKEYPIKPLHSLRISRSGRKVFEREIGFMAESKKSKQLHELNQRGTYADKMTDAIISIVYVGEEDVYDLTEPVTSHFVANGIAVHNCSEYLFLDDTACNLSSINLMKFYHPEERTFDWKAYEHVCRVMITAQEILVGNSSYPSKLIEENSHKYRPLGLGYSNLGALLMVNGIPYNSQEGRDIAATMASVMTSAAYDQSANIAALMGPFDGYNQGNKESMVVVMQKHRQANRELVDSMSAHVPQTFVTGALRGDTLWREVVKKGDVGYRNAQATVLAPTGTISFLMDCSTTGIEPEIGLIKTKNLAGGGSLRIVNELVPMALTGLGYTTADIDTILSEINTRYTVEHSAVLAPAHQTVFDCAFPAEGSERCIEPEGHVRMLGAVQPFLSGAISKTVNMPESATAADIANVYILGWEVGAKAIAVYRNHSKSVQPLVVGKQEASRPALLIAEEDAQPGPPQYNRNRLNATRKSKTHKFDLAGLEGYITVGEYDDGRPGEVFILLSKQGSIAAGLMDAVGVLTSISLQSGVPLGILVDKFKHTRFEPSGWTTNSEIRQASSVLDYIFRWIELEYGTNDTANLPTVMIPSIWIDPPANLQEETITVGSNVKQVTEFSGDTCYDCGGMMQQSGSCLICTRCNSTTGCG